MCKIRFVYIMLVLIMISSCSVFKKQAVQGDTESVMKTGKFLREVSDKNLTDSGFRFDRVRVILTEGGETRRFTANIKYSNEGKLLVSVRIIASIELARLYIDQESIIIVDRINRVYSTGSTKDILARYGLNSKDIPILFGDLPQETVSGERIRCVSGTATLLVKTMTANYNAGFDCTLKKLISLEGTSPGYSINLVFGDFNNSREALFPSTILFREQRSGTNLEFSFSGYSDFNGIIEPPDKPSRYDIGKVR